MRSSNHYNLNLVEGSDLVNPLVQDVPNYEAIDNQMYDNAVASIGLATELKSGTVHALTRNNPDAPMFRFVATSRYDEGDTFTVDGIQVSGLLTDGTTLSDGAYAINANVLCCLVGSVLTLFTVPGAIATAQNSLKLGGQLPSYYGKDSDVQSALTTANAAGLLANNLNTKLTDLPQGVLNIGETTVNINDINIRENGLIDVYVSKYGLAPTDIVVGNGSCTLTFTAQSETIYVKVRCI